MPASLDFRLQSQVFPGCLQRGNRASGVVRTRRTEREHVPLGTNFTKSLLVPRAVINESLVQDRVQRNRPALTASVLLRPTARQRSFISTWAQARFFISA